MAPQISTRSQFSAGVRDALHSLPPGRTVKVRAEDGTKLHTRVFGPENGYPIVLCHGITCTHRAWTYQIADLSVDHRVIAFDHRGHGRSSVPRRGGYTLDRLAGDLDAVLDATLNSRERAVIAGHSMGGITIAAWAQRRRDAVAERADGVAFVNTATGDLLRELKLLKVPDLLSAGRILAAKGIVRAVGSLPIPPPAQWTSRLFVSLMGVGADAPPGIAEFVHKMFAETAPAARGGCLEMLADEVGPEHLRLNELPVPALVIGSKKDRLVPMCQSRRIAEAVPNLLGLVELAGGHCGMLERPDEVTKHLRELVMTASQPRRATS